MEWLFGWLPVVGCAAMMVLSMTMMGGMGPTSHDSSATQRSDEVARLHARIAELERRLEVETSPRNDEPAATQVARVAKR